MNEQQEAWIENLIDQWPQYENVIRVAAQEAAGGVGADFGDHVLGALEEAGADV